MLKWYSKLYVGDSVRSRSRRLRWKISAGIGTLGIYLITIAANPNDQFDIISTLELQKKAIRKRCPLIIGMANGKEEAFDLIERIYTEALLKGNTADARTWLVERIKGIDS